MALTAYQIADASILDLNNKQIYLGNGFQITTGSVALTGTSEVALLSIACPSTTTKSIFVSAKNLNLIDASATTGITYRFYKNPTGVTGGSSITPVNLKFNSVNTSVAILQKSPTVSANGTVFLSQTVYQQSQGVNTSLIIIDPGSTLLITAQPSASTTALMSFGWYEL
jgi:glutamine cyclotransferase